MDVFSGIFAVVFTTVFTAAFFLGLDGGTPQRSSLFIERLFLMTRLSDTP
jgi:hypothetical protein